MQGGENDKTIHGEPGMTEPRKDYAAYVLARLLNLSRQHKEDFHSLLTQQLLEVFLASCTNETRKLLLFTTHDLMLMDQNFFRRDELRITQRRKDGASELISFAEYDDIRSDKDIRKSYLQGHMGGIPNIVADQIRTETGN
jgi:AAA15 family ATPase/GTPase